MHRFRFYIAACHPSCFTQYCAGRREVPSRVRAGGASERRAALEATRDLGSIRHMNADDAPSVRLIHGIVTPAAGRYPPFHDHADGLAENVVDAFIAPLGRGIRILPYGRPADGLPSTTMHPSVLTHPHTFSGALTCSCHLPLRTLTGRCATLPQRDSSSYRLSCPLPTSHNAGFLMRRQWSPKGS